MTSRNVLRPCRKKIDAGGDGATQLLILMMSNSGRATPRRFILLAMSALGHQRPFRPIIAQRLLPGANQPFSSGRNGEELSPNLE